MNGIVIIVFLETYYCLGLLKNLAMMNSDHYIYAPLVGMLRWLCSMKLYITAWQRRITNKLLTE